MDTQDFKPDVFSLRNQRVQVGTYIYVELADNPERRLSGHNGRKNKTTRPYRPFALIHSETFEIRIKTGEREKFRNWQRLLEIFLICLGGGIGRHAGLKIL